MSAIVIRNKEREIEKFGDINELLDRYNDMYRYSVVIGAELVYVVEKHAQPTYWERGWAE